MKLKISNLLLALSILLFISVCSLHVFNTKKVAKAVGSSGGRIVAIVMPRSPDCTPQLCACNSSLMTTIMPAGGTDAVFCIPLQNIPTAGVPVTMASIGYQLIGFWTVTEPMAVSANWGTSL